jgi:hypothetical protein
MHPTVKLGPKRYGPFTITHVISPMVYQLDIPAQWRQKRLHDVFHASLLTPHHETSAHSVNFQEPPPDIIDREEEYEVERILDSR